MDRLSVEQMVRNLLEQAESDGLIRYDLRPSQELSAGEVVGVANLLNEYIGAERREAVRGYVLALVAEDPD